VVRGWDQPNTIIRSTQLLEFLGAIAEPIAADDGAAIVALAATRNGIVDIAGPERASFNEIVARYLKVIGDRCVVVSDAEALYYGGRVEERSLLPFGERGSAASL
jgi:uncharacterized protein YbjT (DUF2867 family)